MSEFERQHPAAAISRLFEAIKQNLVTVVIFLFVGFNRSGDSFAVYAILGGFVFALIYGVLSWWQYKFRVVDGELQIYSGVLVKKKLFLGKDRIQVIDITEGIVQRVFGLVQMDIKTAGSGTEKASISAITREKALELQSLLRKTEKEENAIEGMERVPLLEKKLQLKELLYAALTSGSFGVIASIFGAISSQLDSFINEDSIGYISDNLPIVSDFLIYSIIGFFFLLIGWVLSFFGVIIQYMDFKIQKHKKELVITRGLFEKKQITIPFDRIQAVRIVEGFLRMPLGRGMIYIESAGFELQKSRSVVAMPIIKMSEIEDFLSDFLGEYHLENVVVRPPKRAFMKYIRRPNYLFFLLVPALAFVFSLEFLWLFLLCLPLGYFGWKSYRDSGAYLGEKLMVIKERFFSRKTILMNKSRVQVARVHANPFQVRKNLASFKVTVASGQGGISFEIKDLESEDAERLLKWPVLKSVEY